MKVRLLSVSDHGRPGDVLEVQVGFGRDLIKAGQAEPIAEEGDAGESVGPIAQSDPSDPDAHGQDLETHMRRQPETGARRKARPR